MSNNDSNNTGNNTSNSSRNSSSNRLNVPEARQAMDQFKMQSANEVGVNLKQGYNGDLTSREAGDLGKAGWSRRFGPYEVRDLIGTAELRLVIAREWST